jgi:hypothetical protein
MSANPSEPRPNELFPPFVSLVGSGLNRTWMAIAQLWSGQGKVYAVAKYYGLTLVIHSGIESFARHVQELVPAGNVYINRSIIGPVMAGSWHRHHDQRYRPASRLRAGKKRK